MSETESARSSGIQVIARAAAILRVLRDHTEGMSLGQIAEKVDLPRSTVQRIVGALQAERLVIASSSGGSIRLGPEITALSEATHYNVVEECRLHLSELSRKLGETADLSVLRGAGMIFLDQVPGTHRLRTVSAVGDVFPLTTTANGRAALSLLPEAQARTLVEAEWARRKLPADWPAFAALLAQVRETGLAYDRDEHTGGISAIGFAFRDRTNEVLAISVPVPSQRFETILPNIEAALRDTYAVIAQEFAPLA
ncbi:IclR family transcriptional regulator [Pannonibacter sp. Q-1]|uniref:Transcriptional regulator n=1 Tax=Pannonibacter phragmitetus TaxID=121719 RepID=A0A0U3NFQ5_9HYPH|nr:IclR family transcriptional regulator [Pannonibacter phragmitetus]ALV28496.1 transcriptional regulator [Pannonibacter phragmitetus]MBA4207177.1 DNA-binding transcriptional regulator KdgR [Polymorphum sp.]